MDFPLLRYSRLLDVARIVPMQVSCVVTHSLMLQARSDSEAIKHMQENIMQNALLKAAKTETHKLAWEFSQRYDGLHIYAEFYVLTQKQLARLLDEAFLLGRSDHGTMV